MAADENNSRFITKNWIIGILLILLGFFAQQSISTTIDKTELIEARQTILEKETAEKIKRSEERITVLETQFSYIVKSLDEIKREVKK